MKYKAILLFGAPGSGKGTQGKILGAVPGLYGKMPGPLPDTVTPYEFVPSSPGASGEVE